MRRSIFITGICLALGAGLSNCSAAPTSVSASPESAPDHQPSTREANDIVPGAPGCSPASPQLEQPDILMGTPVAEGASAHMLIFQGSNPLTASEQTTKIVSRVTGDGQFNVEIRNAEGVAQPLVWGPEKHESSTFDFPGEEWGFGVVIDDPGCWQIDLYRGGAEQASFWMEVAPVR